MLILLQVVKLVGCPKLGTQLEDEANITAGVKQENLSKVPSFQQLAVKMGWNLFGIILGEFHPQVI